MCGELHSCGAATEPCECLLRGAARTLQLHAALCGAGTPAAAPGRGTLASFARPRGICKLCRVTPARRTLQSCAEICTAAAHSVAASEPAHRRAANLQPRFARPGTPAHRHTSLEPVNCQLTVNNVCCLCPVFPCRVLMSHQLNMKIVLYLSRNTNLSK